MVTLGVEEGTKGREGKKEGTGGGGEGKEEKGQENVQWRQQKRVHAPA